MFKTLSSSASQPGESPSFIPANPLLMLRDLLPLIFVILCLFGVLVATESLRFSSINLVQNPKSKPTVQNEDLLLRTSR